MNEYLGDVLDQQAEKRKRLLQRALYMKGASLAHFRQYEEARQCFQKLVSQGCPWGKIGLSKLQATIKHNNNVTAKEKAALAARNEELRRRWHDRLGV